MTASKPRITYRQDLPEGASKPKRARPMGVAYTGASQVLQEMQGWFVRGGDADSAILELETLRKRSYDLMRNSPIVSGAISTHRIETVGPGLALQSRVNHRMLRELGVRLTETQVAELEDQIESVFQEWADDPRECDIEQTKTFSDHQDLMLVSELAAGEGIALAVQRARAESPWALRLQAIHPARLSNPRGHPPSLRMDGGIERDEDSAVVRYHFLEAHPHSYKLDAPHLRWRAIDRYSAVSGRQQVFHLFRSDQPGQSRGFPLLAPVIHKLKQLDRYTDSEIMAAVVGGMLSVIFTSENGDQPNFDDDSDLREAAENFGIDTEKDLAIGHGTMMTAPDGMQPNVVSPGRPNPSFDAFTVSVLRQIGVALELPFEVLVGHFQSSYSAARAAILKAWKGIIVRRERLSRHFCTPVYRTWLYEAASTRMLNMPEFWATGRRGMLIRHAYGSCSWIGPPRGSIDPAKEYNAELDLNDALLRPKSDISQLLTGQDWDVNIHKIAREERLVESLGLRAGRRTSTGRDDEPDAADQAERAERAANQG